MYQWFNRCQEIPLDGLWDHGISSAGDLVKQDLSESIGVVYLFSPVSWAEFVSALYIPGLRVAYPVIEVYQWSDPSWLGRLIADRSIVGAEVTQGATAVCDAGGRIA